MSNGYYQIHRGWMDNPVFAGKLCRAAAWVWLIEHAAWRTGKIDVLGHTVPLRRGQLCYSTRHLGKAWGWSEASVRRFLTRLKTDAMIDAATDAGRTLITICNYSKYQSDKTQPDAATDAQSDARATHERRIKEEGKERNIESLPNGKGTEAPKAADPAKPCYDIGKPLLQRYDHSLSKAGGLITRWLKSHPPEILLTVLQHAGSADRHDIVAFIEGCLRNDTATTRKTATGPEALAGSFAKALRDRS